MTIRGLLLATCLAAGGASCGYSTRPDHGQKPLAATQQLPKIAVLPFDNDTFRRNLENRLSVLVADEIRIRSPQSPESKDKAEWLVTGTITRASERVLSGDIDDSVRESSFIVDW
ncbi:MAG: hypothetical protein AAGD14_12430 [Planctomycetota bacterium]